MGLFKILKVLSNDNKYDEKEMDRYELNNEERDQVRKGNYQPDEFDRDDDEDRDED